MDEVKRFVGIDVAEATLDVLVGFAYWFRQYRWKIIC